MVKHAMDKQEKLSRQREQEVSHTSQCSQFSHAQYLPNMLPYMLQYLCYYNCGQIELS